MLLRQRHDVVVIHKALVVDAVLNRVVDFSGEIHRRAMRQVTTISKTHSQHRIAGLEQSVVNRDIGAGTRVRLNIGVVGAKQCFGALNGEHLSAVDKFTATVVALARITLGVLIG